MGTFVGMEKIRDNEDEKWVVMEVERWTQPKLRTPTNEGGETEEMRIDKREHRRKSEMSTVLL